jgi:transketolase
MKSNSKIFVITGDLGYGILDDIRTDFPDRFLNVGSAEMLMIGVAIGLSYSGYIPVCYSITPFLLYRPFEMIRNYINFEKINIKLVGSGRDHDYSHDGITHWGDDDLTILKCFSNIKCYKPEELTTQLTDEFFNSLTPAYINLKR